MGFLDGLFGENTQTTTQNQTSNPWQPAIPGLQNLISQIKQRIGAHPADCQFDGRYGSGTAADGLWRVE